jgi:hypothetical protein
MPTWYAQQNSVNINAANVWNSAANGSGTWLTWAALGPTDVLMWNGRTNITINVSVLCASLRCSNFGGATAGGSGTIANGVTITADLYGSGNSNNFLSITGSANCTIIGSLYGHDFSAAILTVSSSGTIAITGNLIGGSLSTSRSECLRQSAGVVIITGEITNALNVATGIPTVSLSGGTLNVVGNITGGGGSANSADAVTVTGGTLNVTGNVQGGTGWQGVTIGGSGTVVVNGSSIAGTYPAIMSSVNTPTARAICNGDMIAGANGCVAVSVPTLLINGSGALTHTYRTNNAGVAGVARSLYTGGVNIGQPAIANVRFGTQFGASSEYTGALRVPDPQYVSQGVLTDNTVGTLTGSLDATELRAAMGLASANLDTQLATINTRTSSIYSLLQLTDADVASIKTTVEGLVAAIWSAGTRTLTSISDSSGITTLLNRITALVRTKAEDDAADTLIRDDIAAIEGAGGTIIVTIPEIIAANVADESTEDLVRYRGTLWTITIEALAEIPDKCYFTLKRGGEPDARAAAQILKTDPADNANDGLKVLMGATAATAAQGSITYSSYSTTGGTRYRATASIAAVASVRFPVASYRFDFKDVATGAVLGEGTVNVIDPVTLATA